MVVKRGCSTTKKGCFSGEHVSNYNHKFPVQLTSTEKKVLFMITQEFLTAKQIQIRRQCSQQAISKVICSLKKKGALTIGNSQINSPNEMEVVKSQSTPQPNDQIRLHGQEWNIRILFKDYRFREIRDKSNTLIIDGNTIRLYKDSIEIYSGQSFYEDEVQKATAKSMEYWTRFFIRLEHEFNVILVKPRSQNIKLVNAHYAETNNELSRDCEVKAEKIRVYTTDDGRLWFTIDNSFSMHEAETLHPNSAKEDMQETVRPYFNDLRDKSHDLPSQTKASIGAILDIIKEVSMSQLQTNETIISQTKLLEALLPKPMEERKDKQERISYVG